MIRELAPSVAREPEAERLHGRVGDAAPFQVRARRVVEPRGIEDRRRFHKLEELFAPVLFLLAAARVHDLHARLLREHFERALEIQPLDLLDETEHIAADTASEAVIRPALWRDEEGGGTLRVKGAPRAQIRAASFQLHVLRNDVDNR